MVKLSAQNIASFLIYNNEIKEDIMMIVIERVL